MGLIEWLIRRWQASRLLCHYCREVPVDLPGSCCSAECEEWAHWNDRAP